MTKEHGSEGHMQSIAEFSVSQTSEAVFAESPFVKPYLSTGLYKAVPFNAQFPAPNTTANSFFNRTINTPNTIQHAMGLIHHSIFRLKPRLSPSKADVARLEEEMHGAPQFILLVKTGDGLNGFQDTIHGGVLASLFDESLGCCAERYRAAFCDDTEALYTARLDVSYRAPVPSSCIVMIKTWMRRRDGRKWFLDAELLTEDGKVRGAAKSLWISKKV
ncbi:HotDog domain-containing protein [Aspergillus nidulans var. acristatus]